MGNTLELTLRKERDHNPSQDDKDNLKGYGEPPLNRAVKITRGAEIEPICNIQSQNHDCQLSSNESSSMTGASAFGNPDGHERGLESRANATDQSTCDDELIRVGTCLHTGTDDEQGSTDDDKHSTTKHLAAEGADETADKASDVVNCHDGALEVGIVGVDIQILEQDWS